MSFTAAELAEIAAADAEIEREEREKRNHRRDLEKYRKYQQAWRAAHPNYQCEYYASRAEEIKAKRRDKYAAMKKLEEVSA